MKTCVDGGGLLIIPDHWLWMISPVCRPTHNYHQTKKQLKRHEQLPALVPVVLDIPWPMHVWKLHLHSLQTSATYHNLKWMWTLPSGILFARIFHRRYNWPLEWMETNVFEIAMVHWMSRMSSSFVEPNWLLIANTLWLSRVLTKIPIFRIGHYFLNTLIGPLEDNSHFG